MSDAFHLNYVSPEQQVSPFMEHNRMQICSMGTDSSVLRVELTDASRNLHGVAHGGLLTAMADCAAGVTARAGGEDYITLSSHYSFLRNVRSGAVYARADMVKRGRQIAVLRVSVTDEGGTLLLDGTVEMIHRENRPDGASGEKSREEKG